MRREEIEAKVNDILATGFEIDRALLKPDAYLANDLGLDSLDGVDLVVAIERKFGCRIDEAEARSMRTIEDIYSYIEKRALNSAGDVRG